MPNTLQSLLSTSQELLGHLGMDESAMPPVADGSASFGSHLPLPIKTAWRQRIPIRDPSHQQQLLRMDDVLQCRREECRRHCLQQFTQTLRALRNDESLTRLSNVAMISRLSQALNRLYLDSLNRLDTAGREWQASECSRSCGDDTSFPEEVTEILERAFLAAPDSRLTAKETGLIASVSGLSCQQVRTWFSNRRARNKRLAQRSAQDGYDSVGNHCDTASGSNVRVISGLPVRKHQEQYQPNDGQRQVKPLPKRTQPRTSSTTSSASAASLLLPGRASSPVPSLSRSVSSSSSSSPASIIDDTTLSLDFSSIFSPLSNDATAYDSPLEVDNMFGTGMPMLNFQPPTPADACFSGFGASFDMAGTDGSKGFDDFGMGMGSEGWAALPDMSGILAMLNQQLDAAAATSTPAPTTGASSTPTATANDIANSYLSMFSPVQEMDDATSSWISSILPFDTPSPDAMSELTEMSPSSDLFAPSLVTHSTSTLSAPTCDPTFTAENASPADFREASLPPQTLEWISNVLPFDTIPSIPSFTPFPNSANASPPTQSSDDSWDFVAMMALPFAPVSGADPAEEWINFGAGEQKNEIITVPLDPQPEDTIDEVKGTDGAAEEFMDWQ